MKRITGLEQAYTPMTPEEQNVCVVGLKRIANGNTAQEDIRHFAQGGDSRCKRWKPSRESIIATGVSIRIVYIEYEDRIHVIDMEVRSDDTYHNAKKKLAAYFTGEKR